MTSAIKKPRIKTKPPFLRMPQVLNVHVGNAPVPADKINHVAGVIYSYTYVVTKTCVLRASVYSALAGKIDVTQKPRLTNFGTRIRFSLRPNFRAGFSASVLACYDVITYDDFVEATL